MNSKKLLYLLILWPSISFSAWFNNISTRNFINCGNTASLVPSSTYTLVGWLNTLSDNVNQFIIGRSTNIVFSSPFMLRAVQGGGGSATFLCGIRTTAGTFNVTWSGCGLGIDCFEENQWNHFGCVYDGTTLTPYLNGVAFGTPLSVTGDLVYDANINFTMGRIDTGPAISAPLNGQITDLAIYNRALSATEIETLYNSFQRNTNTDGRLGYWPLDEYPDGLILSSETFVDRSGNGFGCQASSGTSRGESRINYP